MKINLLRSSLLTVLALASASMLAVADDSNTMVTPAAPTTNAPSTTAPASTKAPSTKPTQYSGSITALSDTSVTVTSTKKTLTLAIAATTKYRVGSNKNAALSDFKVGDTVTGSYITDGSGNLTAKSIHKKK